MQQNTNARSISDANTCSKIQTVNISQPTAITSSVSTQTNVACNGGSTSASVTVNGGTYTTDGTGSPAIYSTADITVNDATLTSTASQGVVVEGKNSVTLNNVTLSADNNQHNSDKSDVYEAVMIYQSMSGDAASGTSCFTMTGGSLTSKNGHVFHVTNTSAVITLENVAITNEDSDNILLSVCDDGWSGGSNNATLNASAQKLSGAIKVGDNSTLTLSLTNGSSFEGYIDGKITNAAGIVISTEAGTVSVSLDDSSTWSLTSDSYVTEFDGNAANIISNGYTLYVNGVALNGTN